MQNQSDILKYIDNEKEVSRCKVSILESITDLTFGKKKSLYFEKALVKFPFDVLDISNKSSADGAIYLYRNNRALFREKYLNNINKNNFNNIIRDYDLIFEKFFCLYKKIIFLEEAEGKFKKALVQQINPVQNKFIFNELRSYGKGHSEEYLLSLNNDELIDIEPLIVSKKRARAQAIIMSIGLFITKELERIKNNNLYAYAKECLGDLKLYNKNIDNALFKTLLVLNEDCDCIIDNIDYNIFKYYNDTILLLSDCLAGTMGRNRYLKKLRSFESLFGDKYLYDKNTHLDGSLLECPSVVKMRKATEGGGFDYGIIFPIRRSGNERMFPFYYKIASCGVDISSHVYSKFFNTQCSDSEGESGYCKAMFFKPTEYLEHMADASGGFNLFYKKLTNLTCYGDNNKSYVYDEYNMPNEHGNFIPIDISRSCIYISKTRTDGEIMFSAMKCVNVILENFKSDYFDICLGIEFSIKNRISNRRSKIFSYGN